MIDFTSEKIMGVEAMAEYLGVAHDTIYRWFKQGLEHAKVGGKVFTSLEAIQRFSKQSDNTPRMSKRIIDRETREAIRSLRERFGIVVGPDAKPSKSRRNRRSNE